MTKPTSRAFGLTLAACLLAALALAVPASSEKTSLTAKLAGSEEVKKGDEDGSGTATVKTDDEKGTVCFKLTYSGIDAPTKGHIHKGVKGKDGKIVVTLFDGEAKKSGCVKDVSKSLVKQIAAKPAGFYPNLHNEAFPDGAVRGQLAAEKPKQ